MTQELNRDDVVDEALEADLDTMTATKETLEDYTLRFAPRSYRKWSTRVVGISALGGIAYLADFAIGANIGISYGTTNALWGIAIFAVVIFATGFPVAYYSARYNIDLDLVTRGSGFGYYGSVITNVIFATFTFIFFALEGSIMAQGLQLGLGIPLWIGYAASTLVIFPLVIYGMKVLSMLQVWTTPLWLVLMVAPFVYLVISHPESIEQFFAYRGENGQGGFDLGSTLLAAGVCLSLIAQIAEQNDYLRFMPPQTPENKRSWWTWLILAGPGWVFFGAIKQIVGLFLAVYLIANVADSAGIANQPVHQFLEIYENFLPGWLAMTLAVVLVVISQIKINVTNAYSGSLAWTNSFTRVTKHYPGRIVFLGAGLLRRSRPGDPAVLTAGGDRACAGAAADHRDRDQGQVLPAPHRRRHRPADVRRVRQPVREDAEMPCLPSRLRAARHDEVGRPRGLHLFAVPEHRQDRGARPDR